MTWIMIVAVHAATGAVAGTLVRSRLVAALVGVPLHLALDAIPHRDIESKTFEVGSGVALLAVLAATKRIDSPVTVGAAAACAADVEHLIRLPRPGGRKIFHRSVAATTMPRASVRMQLAAAAILLAAVLSAETRPRR